MNHSSLFNDLQIKLKIDQRIQLHSVLDQLIILPGITNVHSHSIIKQIAEIKKKVLLKKLSSFIISSIKNYVKL